ncbi:DUF445 domain-containing protein [Paracoccus marinaquae]|uniref:DUF445 domain-containing protein n=1 Tax=Paracoccus marinaquae TaxID=2841926 RepID=A0ABS6AFZ1_9RHOB|nr:DUF445 domain-containing protein [Paracoccus marinaquae]MBU3029433.1 DUF445 domain-containing protein [Paracoccus marinaquae]
MDALRRTRRLAGQVLAGLTVVYFATYLIGVPPGWLMLVRAMAEAGMVGGLADWFAVTALFRHPLGIPIPHTALLPKNQARAARNVGRFFETHFLEPAQLEARVRALEPSGFIAGWVSHPQNARLIARDLSGMLAAVLRHDPPPRALARGRQWLRAQAAHLGSDAAIAAGIADLVKVGARRGLLDDTLALVQRTIDENRDTAVDLVRDRSRWWIASGVDREVANLVVRGVLSMLDELHSPDSSLRRGFEEAFDGMVERLAETGALTRAVTEARLQLIRSGAFDSALGALTEELRADALARLAEEPDLMVEPIAELVRGFAGRALADPAARAAFDARLAELAGRMVGELRPQIATYVADVIAGWEPAELNARFEAELGPDLQYIRINGAVLGTLIGGALFGFEALLG